MSNAKMCEADYQYRYDVYNDDDQYIEIINIEYDAEENSFYDQCGIHITNVLEMITPNDLLLFRQNPCS